MNIRSSRARPGFLLVLQRELRWIRRRPALTLMPLVFPLSLFGLLAAVFYAGLPSDLPVAVLDKDRSTLSRQVIRMIDATLDASIAYRVEDLSAGRRLILEGKAYAVVMMPANLERDVAAGRRPDIAVFYNNQFMTAGSILSRAIGDALANAEAGVGISSLTKRGEPFQFAQASLTPIPVRQSPLFNPSLNYVYFLLAALIPAILQIFICAASAYSIGLERTTIANMRVLTRLGGGIAPAMFGKLLPYTLAFSATLWIADAILFGYLGAPFRGDWRLLAVSGILFVVAYQLMGGLFSLVARDIVHALGYAGIYTAPSFGFIGVSFPRSAMPLFAQVWGALLPVTWYMQIRIDQTVRGAPVMESLRPLGYLALSVAILTILSVLRLLQLRIARLRAASASKEVTA
ncbi:MAG: ABC transporter permease [Rhodomicrobium sp.]